MSHTTHRAAVADRRAQARKVAEAAAAAERRRARRNRVLVGAGITAAIAGLVTLGALTGQQPAAVVDHSAHAAAANSAGSGLPPWANAADPSAAIRAAGLTPATTEGSAEHYHAHLDVLVNGQKVPVAPNIGADIARQVISPLHTHDGSGAIHIESPTVGDAFYLGQLFTEWDVALSADRVGGLRADGTTTLRVFVNGKQVDGDPAKIRLAAHQEIALVFGPADQKVDVPSTYDFGNL